MRCTSCASSPAGTPTACRTGASCASRSRRCPTCRLSSPRSKASSTSSKRAPPPERLRHVTASDLCLLDGRIVPLAAARISPLDRGFLFGDSIYEALKVRAGRILFLSRHLDRLRASLAALRIPEPAGIATELEALRAQAKLTSGALYLQITRGVAAERRHLPPP